jgi:hypothetical protein
VSTVYLRFQLQLLIVVSFAGVQIFRKIANDTRDVAKTAADMSSTMFKLMDAWANIDRPKVQKQLRNGDRMIAKLLTEWSRLSARLHKQEEALDCEEKDTGTNNPSMTRMMMMGKRRRRSEKTRTRRKKRRRRRVAHTTRSETALPSAMNPLLITTKISNWR